MLVLRTVCFRRFQTILQSHVSTRSLFRAKIMYRMTVVLVLLVALGVCTAQLNFSTGWGKRAPGGSISPSADNCKSATDTTIMLLYKIIQAEAQKLVDCERYAK